MFLPILFALSTLSASGEPKVSANAAGDGAPQGSIATLVFVATGARSSTLTNLATAFHCTNIGVSAASISVYFYDYTGGLPTCSLVSLPIPATHTFTGATANTAAYSEDVLCTGTPSLGQGKVEIYLNSGDPQKLICTLQVLDPTAAIPASMTSLDLYRVR